MSNQNSDILLDKDIAEEMAGHRGEKLIPVYAIPEGYCIVPIEPTEAMLRNVSLEPTRQLVGLAIYKAMLLASQMNVPPPSTQEVK